MARHRLRTRALARRGRVDVRRAAAAHRVLLLTVGAAEALHAIHAAGIVHRDLKPANVLLAPDGPRVVDFGIARAADSTVLTGTGVSVGTPSFMAPEQAAAGTVTPATAVFALGQIAAYAAIGASAYGDGPSHAVLYRIVHEEPDLSRVPPELRPLLARCLDRDPAGRPALTEVIARCQGLSPTPLRQGEDWLPQTLAGSLNARRDLPEPARTPPPAAPTPTAHSPARAAAPAAARAPWAGRRRRGGGGGARAGRDRLAPAGRLGQEGLWEGGFDQGAAPSSPPPAAPVGRRAAAGRTPGPSSTRAST
ncbi:protein kinase [Streptomyces xanthophaeus]|uniref:protein kinase domain-containing protein n=1 Tax=Streptomyces xanthophaeus TaxID=67385 RepID=UPI0036C4DE72